MKAGGAAGDVSDDDDSTDSLGDDNADIETILYVQENGKQVFAMKFSLLA